MDTAAASDAFNAVEIYAISGAAAIQRMNAKGKKITPAKKCPRVIYHRTTKGNWKGILRDGFVAGGGERLIWESAFVLQRGHFLQDSV